MNNIRRRACAAKDKNYDGSKATALSVLFVNNQDTSIKAWFRKKDWPNSGWTPIGIVVVPGSHNRYGDGTCGVMSLVSMSITTPETGTAVTSASQEDYNYQTNQNGMRWGYENGSIGNNIYCTTNALTSGVANIPYQTSADSTECTRVGGSTLLWPYQFTDTNNNTSIPTSAPSTESYSGAAAYFNGICNTVAIYVKTRFNPQWTASTVDNTTGTSNTPAAACAGRFKTIGTNSFLEIYNGTSYADSRYGTANSPKSNRNYWYLPSLGELCYIPCKKFEINKIITALNQKYGNVATLFSTDRMQASYWSSTEYNKSKAWCLLYLGSTGYSTKILGYCARAFLRF